MKRIVSLMMAASILLQTVIPVGSMVAYAQTVGPLYGLKWEQSKSLSRELVEDDQIKTGEEEALVSWNPKDVTGKYILEYFVEDGATANGSAEKVQLTFNRPNPENAATLGVKVFNKDGDEDQGRKYQQYNITTGKWDNWDRTKDIAIEIGSNFPGGSILVGDSMEIRFKWTLGGTIYVQTNNIKNGNITPFSLSREGFNIGKSDKVEVLAGLEGYKISPIHIQIDEKGKISDKRTIKMPGEEHPGSKPGVKVEFQRPKWLNGTTFEWITPTDAEKIGATLDIKDLTGKSAQLSFKLDENDLSVTGLNNVGKKLTYNAGTYTLYLAEDDINGRTDIIKWDALKGSSIFDKVDLTLNRDVGLGPDKLQPLGIFTPKKDSNTDDMGRYTYLKYAIERSSLQDAYIEIEPYRGAINTEFTYTVQTSTDNASWITLLDHKYTSTDMNDNTSITIPVPFSITDENRYYKVIVKYSQGTMYSQTLHYKPKEDLTIPPPTPIIQSIDNIYVVPAIKEGGQPETIGFDLTWSAPKNSIDNKILEDLLTKGNIYYELSLHDKPEAEKELGTLIKTFKVGLSEEKGIYVEPYAGTSGNDPAPNNRYSQSKDTFTMENVVLKKSGLGENEGWERIASMPEDYDKDKKAYPTEDEIKVDNGLHKEVPGIYYLTMRALYEPDPAMTTGPAITMGVSDESNPKPITISPLEEVIPVPTKIESRNLIDDNNLNRIRQSFSWGNIDLTRYIKQMLAPLKLEVGGNGKGTYEIYLYQKKNIDEEELISTTPVAITLDSTKTDYKLDDEDLKALREGKALRLDYTGSSSEGMNNITIEGLDANQVYYSVIRVRLDIKDKDGKDIEPRYSVFSKEHSFTTYVKPGEPGPGERVPPVPEELKIVDQPNNTTATIGWKAPNYNKQVDEKLYYEMVRVDSRTLAKEEDSRLLSIEKLIAGDTKDEIEAWHTENSLIDRYEKETSTWIEAVPKQNSSKLQLEDDGLSPNKIYYYYVRTVLVVEGEETYSSWVGIPVTTDPIQKPIMLKVEDTDAYSHDPKREIVISFLAPIPKDADVPSEYDFDIAVQGELDTDYRLDYLTTRLTSTEEDENIPTGYAHFVYKIRSLKPGKRYDIKVRVIDKVVDMVNEQYPKSLYSDRVTTRTHFDQDEQDKDDKFEEYLKYFEDKVEALRRKPYWTVEDGTSRFAIKYRSNYIIPEISSGGAYELAIREDVSDFTYYMPASVITDANAGQTSFEIKQGNVTYSVRPSTITTDLEELRVTLKDISEKYIRDYYVSFHFRQIPQAQGSSIDGFLTPKIIVDIELVRLKEEDLFLEDDIMVALNEEIKSERVKYIDELEKALEKGKILKEDLDRIIERSLGIIERNHQKDVSSILRKNTSKVVPIDNWNKSMLIMAMLEGDVIAQGYLLGWKDEELPTMNVAGGYAIETNQSGTYAFKGQKVTMPVIPGVGGAGNLVTKYQLTDFFGIDGMINPNNMAIKKDVLGAMARVLGAQRGADYIQYLKQANIQGVTNIGMNLPMKKGEGIYLLMQVYEKVLKKPIGSVYVKNRNIVSNIREFNPAHQPYILVAVDSKIVSGGNGVRPNDNMEIKEVLQMLTNIMTGIR